MSTPEPLCRLFGINPNNLSKEENLILEIDLFARICEELKAGFKTRYQNYFKTLKFNCESEDTIMEATYVRCVINDLLLTEEYTLSGIAHYTQTPEEIVYEIATGKNTSPSAIILRKIIELHRKARYELYDALTKKILLEISKKE
jgi:GTPase SAR1 family protein